MVPRILQLPFGKRSFFLFGPRQVGKSTLIKSLLSKSDFLLIDLLLYQTLIKYKSNPELLIDEVGFLIKSRKSKNRATVFIDEIQKFPDLLDSVHYLIEKFKNKVGFILTGSSAGKLKKTSANMLAGRAWHYNLFPLTHSEFGEDFILRYRFAQRNTSPSHQRKYKRLLYHIKIIYSNLFKGRDT